MGFTMILNMVLLVSMVATNILSLYHLSYTTNLLQSKPKSSSTHHQPIPEHLLNQLNTLRATINHLTRHTPTPRPTTLPQDLLLYSRLSPIASACENHPDLLRQYMNYTPFSLCPSDSDLADSLILRGCHPLPRRRCFSPTPRFPTQSLPTDPFPSSLPDSNVIWTQYNCKSFRCLATRNPNLGFNFTFSKSKSDFLSYSSELDLPISQLLHIAKSANSVLRLGLDIGGSTGSFAAVMKTYNVTVLTTTMNLNAPHNEAVALRGLIPLHVPLQQRLPVFDGVVDLVRCGHAVNRWIPVVMMEFLLFDIDRVLRGGGYLWLDRFFSKRVDLEKVYKPLIEKLGYKTVKWAVAKKSDPSRSRNGEIYLTALLQKPVSRL